MQRYQPPHLRQRTQEQASSSRSAPSSASGAGRGSGRSLNTSSLPPPASRKDWSTPPRSSNVLASPASDLQPMRGTPIKHMDEMELIQSVSRSGGDGAEGDASIIQLLSTRLKDWGMQERYRRYIDERLDKHYNTYARPRHAAPPTSAEEEIYSLGSIVLLFRKLREGVVASHRIDTFAIEVFQSSAKLSILARNTAQVLSSLGGLVPGLYIAVHPRDKAQATNDKVGDLSQEMEDLEIRDDRAEFVSLLLFFHLTHTKSRQAFHNTLIELTAPKKHRLNKPFSDGQTKAESARPFVSQSSLSFALKADRVLAEATFDPISYFRMITDENVASSYERAVLSWAEESVRERAWKVLSRAYLDCQISWAEEWSGRTGKGVEDWVKERDGRIEGGKVRTR